MRNLYNLPDNRFKEPLENSLGEEVEEDPQVFACGECHCMEVVIYANGQIQCADEECEMLIGNLAQLLGVVLKED